MSDQLPQHLEDKLVKARFSLYEHFPFFGQISQHFKFINANVGTACINANGELKADPKFLEQCNDKDTMFLLCHEAMHIVLESTGRFPEGANPDVWNEAADAIINPMLIDDCKMPKIREQLLKIIYGGKWAKYAKSTHEAAYYDLMQNFEKMHGQTMEEFNKAMAGNKEGDNPQQGRGKGSMKGIWWDNSGSELGKKAQDKGLDKAGNPQSDGGMTEAQKSEWKDRICSAFEAQKSTGDVPGSLQGFITKILKPKKDWRKELRVAVTSTLKDQWSYKKPSRRTTALDIRTPGVWGEKPDCWCALDTSGSMSELELQRAVSEMVRIFELVGGKTHLILCDAEVYYTGDLDVNGLKNLREIQHGGTDLTQIFRYIKDEAKKQPAMLVVFSDMETPFPTRPPKYPVIWCNPGGNGKAPWGKNIKVELGENDE